MRLIISSSFGALILSAVALAPPVSAQVVSSTQNLGNLTNGGSNLGNKFTSASTFGKMFRDVYNFSFAGGAADVDGGAISVSTRAGVGVTFNSVSLMQGSTTLYNGTAFGNFAGFNTRLDNPGNYSLVFNGTIGTKGGSYGGNMNVSAVPEPETYAMFIAGLLLVWKLARRRSSTTRRTAVPTMGNASVV